MYFEAFQLFFLNCLSFISSLSHHVKVLDEDAGEDKNAKSIQVASPYLIMCIRDFFLECKKDETSQTPDQYLEDNLKLDESSVEPRTLGFNKIKKCITEYFPKRKCCVIAQPAMGKNLKNIEKVNESSLSKDFLEDIKSLQAYVYDRKPKYICNASKKPLDGAGKTILYFTKYFLNRQQILWWIYFFVFSAEDRLV